MFQKTVVRKGSIISTISVAYSSLLLWIRWTCLKLAVVEGWKSEGEDRDLRGTSHRESTWMDGLE